MAMIALGVELSPAREIGADDNFFRFRCVQHTGITITRSSSQVYGAVSPRQGWSDCFVKSQIGKKCQAAQAMDRLG